jgi:hypothetical protein
MKHTATTATAVLLALPLVCASFAEAGGGIQTGVTVSQSNAPNNTYSNAEDIGSALGIYQASMANIPGISAYLNWRANGSTFVGTCTGTADQGLGAITGRSRTVTEITLGSNSTFAITYDMQGAEGIGNDVSWGLLDLGSADTSLPVFGLTFTGAAAIAWGGVSTLSSAGSFSGSVAAGTYWLVMSAECTNTGGNFSYDATFTAVPAPGAFPAILMAAALRGRRRR